MKVRTFQEQDYPVWAALRSAADPEQPLSVEEVRQEDASWDLQRYHRARFVAEEADGRLSGWAQVMHMPWHFHPDRYRLELQVDPARRRRGIGGLLYDRLLEELRARGAILARAGAGEAEPESLAFLAKRGFRETWRFLHSRLDLATFDPAPFAGAEERVIRQGVTITTLSEELAHGSDILREVYHLSDESGRSQPLMDGFTPRPFEEWVASEVERPGAILDSWFLARLDDRIIGISSLEPIPGSRERVEVGYTGVHPEYRRRGIATALKLRAIAYARDRGYACIQTDSSAGNDPMLTLNAALGFQRQPARIVFELPL